MVSHALKKGDIIKIPLPGKKNGFIQFIYKDKWGDLIGIYDEVLHEQDSITIEDFKKLAFKYYPILTRIKEGFKISKIISDREKIKEMGISVSLLEVMAQDKSTDYTWQVIGNNKIDHFQYPNFIWKEGGMGGQAKKWYIYDGEQDNFIGSNLLSQYKKLEYKMSYSALTVIELIMGKGNALREKQILEIERG